MTDGESPFPPNQRRLRRRTIITSASTILLAGGAGCMGSFGSSSGATDVFVANNTETEQNITVGVHDANGDYTPLQTALTIPAGEHRNPTRQDQIPWGGDYEIAVDVEDGPNKTYMWTDIHDALYIFLGERGLSFEIRETPPSSWSS